MNRESTKNVAIPLTSLVLLLSSAIANANSDNMSERLTACTSCHDQTEPAQTEQVYAPAINGKPVEYLYQQLLNFREGRRLNAIMSPMLAYLSPEYLREIATYFSQQAITQRSKSNPDQAPDPQLTQRGQLLVHESTADRPACVACHGSDLRGDGVAIPGLRELSPAYITAQLGAWQANTRHAREPDCMSDVAKTLSGPDIDAVAQWIANAPANMPTPTAPIEQLPAPCGAVQ
jgi:cytochrome c553